MSQQFTKSIHLPDRITAIWGFAEATVFFIIPDVFTSYRSLHSWRQGLRACWFTLIGALVGGSLMYALAVRQPATALKIVDSVPAVTAPTIQTASSSYDKDGAQAILYGPIRATPYKIYTVMAPERHIPFVQFIAISAVARMARFVVLTATTAGMSYVLGKWLSMRTRKIIFAVCWLLVYVAYFATHWI